MRAYRQKNHKTNTFISLHKERYWAWQDVCYCECEEHGIKSGLAPSGTGAIDQMMAHPDEWCEQCKAALLGLKVGKQ